MAQEEKFSAPSQEEILEIIDSIAESDFDELRIEIDDFELIVGKGVLDMAGHQAPLTQRRALPLDSHSLRTCVQKERPDKAHLPEETAPQISRDEAAPSEEEGLLPIKSPLLGIFYRAPKPGAPPFVEVGSYITEEDTVCLIEVMKLFNTVKAQVKGRVVKICAENSQIVEYNQTIFLVKEGAEVS